MNKTRSTSNHLLHAAALALALFQASVARGEVPSSKASARLADRARTREVSLDTYETPVEIVRSKARGMSFATFSAAPQPVEAASVILFQLRSVSATGSVERWRCIAVDDVSECFGEGVRLRYLPGDQRMVLTITAKPRTVANLQLAAQARNGQVFAAQ